MAHSGVLGAPSAQCGIWTETQGEQPGKPPALREGSEELGAPCLCVSPTPHQLPLGPPASHRSLGNELYQCVSSRQDKDIFPCAWGRRFSCLLCILSSGQANQWPGLAAWLRALDYVFFNQWVKIPLGSDDPFTRVPYQMSCTPDVYIRIHNSSKFSVMK